MAIPEAPQIAAEAPTTPIPPPRQRPATPSRPATPTAIEQPVEQTRPPVEVSAEDQAAMPIDDTAAHQAEEAADDEAVIAPAAPLEYMAHRPRVVRAPRVPLYKQMGFRQTIIPILLTLGVVMPAVAMMKYVMGADSMIGSLAPWYTWTLLGIGVVMLILAAFNMVQVKNQLEAMAKKKAKGA